MIMTTSGAVALPADRRKARGFQDKTAIDIAQIAMTPSGDQGKYCFNYLQEGVRVYKNVPCSYPH